MNTVEGRKQGTQKLNSREVTEIFSVQIGNSREEGTRENEQQLGGWRISFSEHKKNDPLKATREQQRKKERKNERQQS